MVPLPAALCLESKMFQKSFEYCVSVHHNTNWMQTVGWCKYFQLRESKYIKAGGHSETICNSPYIILRLQLWHQKLQFIVRIFILKRKCL